MENETLKLHELMISRGTFFCYSGPLSEEVLTSLSGAVKEQLSDSEDLPVVKKVFGIFVEQAQNIIRYSVDRLDQSGVGSVAISKTEKGFMIEAVNSIDPKNVDRLEEILKPLTEMNKDELKSAYKDRLRSGPPDGSRGAGLGFIEMARRSSKFDYDFLAHNANTYFVYRGWVE
ncbi:MAG: SiaB family protein kinase [Halieaceae bacterium]|nr:SiaB family protein kinase [Halieaceae bacterium]|tara:strand:+ start:213 stop:734 length:522 start_codon:yes stop_codon:yes gene_type:complete